MRTKRTLKSIIMLTALFAVLSVFAGVKADAAELVAKEVVDREEGAVPVSITLPAGAATATEILPVKLNHSGVLQIYAVGTIRTGLNVYTDAACTKPVRPAGIYFSDNIEYAKSFDIATAGTYYVKYQYESSYAVSSGAQATLCAYAYNGDDKTLTSGKVSTTWTDNYNKTVYHKIVMKSAGYIDLVGKSFASYGTSSLTVRIMNSKKKEIGQSKLLYSGNDWGTRFAVGKGTYYVAVKQSDIYQLIYKSKAIKEKSGKNKKKAVQLKKKKAVNGLMLMGESQKNADWYKIKLTKKAKLKVEVKNYGDDTISMEIIPASKNFILFNRYASISGNKVVIWSTTKKAPKGTYYIKLSKRSKVYSSHYTLKMK